MNLFHSNVATFVLLGSGVASFTPCIGIRLCGA